jgi:hypothetical protein
MANAGRFHGKRMLLICENSVVLVQKVPLAGQLVFGNVYVEWSGMPRKHSLFVNNIKRCSSIEKHSAPIEVVLSVRQREFFDGQAAFAHAVGRRGVDIAEEKSLWPSQHFLCYFDCHI